MIFNLSSFPSSVTYTFMHFAHLPFFIHVSVCAQDGRIKVGDRIIAVGDEPVAGLLVDKVHTHTHSCSHTLNKHFKVKLI